MNKFLIIALCFLFLGCDDKPVIDLESVTTKHKGGIYKRVNIDGVDCVIGSGNYDTTVSVSCDWARKDQL